MLQPKGSMLYQRLSTLCGMYGDMAICNRLSCVTSQACNLCVYVWSLQKIGTDAPVPPDRSLEYVQQYAQAVLDLGTQLQLPVVDVYSRLQAVQDWQTVLLKDGLHFTPAGSMAVWRELQVVLDEQMGRYVQPRHMLSPFICMELCLSRLVGQCGGSWKQCWMSNCQGMWMRAGGGPCRVVYSMGSTSAPTPSMGTGRYHCSHQAVGTYYCLT